MRDGDRCREKTSIRRYDVKCALIAETKLEILGIGGVEKSKPHNTTRNLGEWRNRPIHDNSVTSSSVYDVERIQGVIIVFNRTIRVEGAILQNIGKSSTPNVRGRPSRTSVPSSMIIIPVRPI